MLADAPGGNPEVILIASGSEVSLAVQAHEQLLAEGIRSRVVSMPSWDIFEHQPREYRESVLPPRVKARVAVEQGSTLGWERYVGASGRVIGMKTFGASAPLKELQRKFGFEPERVVAAAKEQLGGEGVVIRSLKERLFGLTNRRTTTPRTAESLSSALQAALDWMMTVLVLRACGALRRAKSRQQAIYQFCYPPGMPRRVRDVKRRGPERVYKQCCLNHRKEWL